MARLALLLWLYRYVLTNHIHRSFSPTRSTAWEYPTNRLLQRLPLGKYSAFNIIMWGMTLCCFAAVKDFGGAVAVRFFLGVFEAAVTPGFALITSQWYTKLSLIHI